MKTVGVTGSIASGKSSVCQFIERFWPVIDADQISREVVAPGQPGLAQLVAAFGSEILLPDGTLDRASMRRTIAIDAKAQQTINQILHPLIRLSIESHLKELEQAGQDVAFVAAALMIESGSYQSYGKILLVSASEESRLARLLERDGMLEAHARALMAKQMPDAQKRNFVQAEIVNDADLATLEQRTWTALAQLGISCPTSEA